MIPFGVAIDSENTAPESPLPELVAALRGFNDLWRSRTRHEQFNSTLPIPLDSTEGWLVWHLDSSGALRAKDLARATGIGKPGVSKALHRLGATGVITTARDPDDGRVTWIRLTSEGQAIAAAMHDAATEMIRASVRSWTDDEQRTLAVLLRRLTAAQASGTADP